MSNVFRFVCSFLALLIVLGFASSECRANHPVLVEGEADFDGDGLIGVDEDNDGDRIFGTIGASLAAGNGGANQNGRVSIVTSGRFAESLLVSGANGNVTIEAAPGVEANIDAVLAGTVGNVARQQGPGIVVDAPGNRSIILRNLVVRSWKEGIIVRGDSHVIIDGCRVEQNLDYGILVQDAARAAIIETDVTGTGYRVGAAGNSPDADRPDPGAGIRFEGSARGVVAHSSSTGNFGQGLDHRQNRVDTQSVVLFDNERGASIEGGF